MKTRLLCLTTALYLIITYCSVDINNDLRFAIYLLDIEIPFFITYNVKTTFSLTDRDFYARFLNLNKQRIQ